MSSTDTTELTGFATGGSNIEAAVDAGLAIGEPKSISDTEPALTSVVIPRGATHKVIDARDYGAQHEARPRRKTGTVKVHNGESFVDYLAKHGLPETETWADAERFAIVAVINAHTACPSDAPGADAVDADLGAGWGDHRCSLQLLKTPAWLAWEKNDRQWLTQADFAEHIEDNANDVIDPDAATMLEIAQSFQASVGTDFKSVERLYTGEVKLKYEETVAARAGQTGDIEVPQKFVLELNPFVGGVTHTMVARFRYRMRSGTLSLSYHLSRPNDVLQEAFDVHAASIEAGITTPVYAGRPA